MRDFDAKVLRGQHATLLVAWLHHLHRKPFSTIPADLVARFDADVRSLAKRHGCSPLAGLAIAIDTLATMAVDFKGAGITECSLLIAVHELCGYVNGVQQTDDLTKVYTALAAGVRELALLTSTDVAVSTMKHLQDQP